ncbi:hypothetical protein B0H14DRAFT_2663373 [Mycena olivaceomarginata]|nr:hypothetical protein B0H14DRAFT_2663373 [Mycena olivaceomarginata]
MDDSPPPAYSKESYPLNPASHNPNGTETPRNASKRAEGRDTFPRPLPRVPVRETSSLKTGTVAPLRLHQKSQSTSLDRPWKPPILDDNRWDPSTPNPQFRHREADFAQRPSPQYSRSPPPAPTPLEHGRRAGHFPTTPIPNPGRERSLPPSNSNHIHQAPRSRSKFVLQVSKPCREKSGASDFHRSPAVSGHLSRASISHMQQPRNTQLDHLRPNQPSADNNPSRRGHVRWS